MNKLSLRTLVKNRKKKGFTLVELIIVIAIIAILAAIAIPKFGQITKNSNITADVATAKNLHGIAAQVIAEDSGVTADNITAKVAPKVDGAASDATTLPNSKVTGNAFTITFDTTTGNITILSGSGNEAYPKQTGKFSKSNSNS